MAPRKSLRVRPALTPRSNRKCELVVIQNPEGTPYETPPVVNTSNPPFQMDPTLMQTLLVHGIATTLAVYEATQNENSENNRNGGDTPNVHQNNSRPCLYKNFMGYKPPSFYGTKGAVGLSRWIEKMEAIFRISACTED